MRLSTFELLSSKHHWVEQFGLPPNGWRRVVEFARQLPAAFTSYYLESPFAEPERLDFLPLLERRRASLEAWSEGTGAGHDQAALAWQRLSRIAAHPDYEQVWLELDFPTTAPAARPAPSIGICVERDYVSRHAGARVRKAESPDAALAALQLLTGAGEGALQRQLLQIHEALPDDGNIINVMLMLGRDPSVLKLYTSLPSAAVSDFLERIGWRGNRERLRWLMAKTGEPLTTFLDLTVHGGVARRIGVAVSQLHLAESSAPDPRWSALLAAWVDAGLASAPRAAQLERWPGGETAKVGGVPLWCTRWLDLKLVLDEHDQAHAKAYYGFRAEPLPPLAALRTDFS